MTARDLAHLDACHEFAMLMIRLGVRMGFS